MSRFAIRTPYLIIVVCLMIVVLGASSTARMPVDMFPAVNEVYRRFFPKDPPARIFINVPAWNGGFDIEVDCVAAV